MDDVLLKLVEDVAVIKTHTMHLVESRKQDQEQRVEDLRKVASLEARVVSLEISRIKTMAWAAGFGAAAAMIAGVLKDKLAHFLAALGFTALMLGCGQARVVQSPSETVPEHCQIGGYWAARPVVVDINDDMTEECLAVVEDSLAFWDSLGVTYLQPRRMPAEYVGFHGLPEDGHIAITQGPLRDGVGGVTGWWAMRDGRMKNADITVKTCSPAVVRHELGHALGLWAHNPTEGRLMYYHTNGIEPVLDECELARIQ